LSITVPLSRSVSRIRRGSAFFVRRQASDYENHTQEKLEGWSSYVFIRRRLFWRSSDYLRQVIEAKHGSFVLFVVLGLCRIERRIFQEEQAGMTGLI
jgi:hypothetical protein